MFTQPHAANASCSTTIAYAQVLERILDLQSVVAHCGGLWSSAVGFSGPERLSQGDKKRVKDRVLKLVHNSIK